MQLSALPLHMPRTFGPRFQAAGVLEADLAQALGFEFLLCQGHAAIEHFRVAADAVALEVEAADAVEHHARTLCLGPL